MASIHLKSALTPQGWQDDVRLAVADGRLVAVEVGVPAEIGDERLGIGVPGVPNLHSHAFQRAMAGLAETRGADADSFWSWREQMYRFALTMTPDDVEAVAGQAYVEMLEAGFTRVGEFHYLHHDTDGKPYGALGEMAERIGAAAASAGIGLTLLPVFYAHGGFGGAPAGEGQRRFLNDEKRYARLLEASRKAVAGLPGAVVGVAPHSLRAAAPAQLQAIVALADGGPVHIHVAEQVREVEECLAWSGARPVQWLLDNAAIDGRWCLIHATHMNDDETAGMAASGAVAGLCPITEANLGDGIFPADTFLEAGGAFGVGSDSNVDISPAGELRQLEYSQRLARCARNVLARPGGSSGARLLAGALDGGARALGAGPAGFVAGASADLVTLRADDPGFPLDPAGLLDAWVFSAGNRLVDTVHVRGRRVVDGGQHRDRARIGARYRATMAKLLSVPRP